MDWLEFVADMTSSLGWPIVTLIIVLLLKSPIRSAADRLAARFGEIARLKAPGLDIEFKQEVRELAESIETLAIDRAPTSALPPEATGEPMSKYQELARLDPRAAILASFADMETLIRKQFQRNYPTAPPKINFTRMIGTYKRDDLISDMLYESILELRDLRNRVTHENLAVDADTANNYSKSVNNLLVSFLLETRFKDEQP